MSALGSTVTDCQTCNVAQQALTAAREFMRTGREQPNPYAGFKLEAAWRSAYLRWILALSAAAGTEASA